MADINVDVIKINTAPAEKSMKSLKQQLKETKEQMMELRMRGEETSDAYKELAARAGDLQRSMDRATEDIKEASTTFTNTVGYVSGSLAGVSGAVQAATGALSLMGVEMGSDTKLMKALVAAMSITSGLQAIQGSVEAFKKLATNIKRSTLAQKGLNAAMKANPMGWAIAAVAALSVALAGFAIKAKKAAKDAKEAMEDAAEKAKEAWEKRIENIKQLLADISNTTASGIDFWDIDEFNKEKDKYLKSLNETGKDIGLEFEKIRRKQREYRKAMTDPTWMKAHQAEYMDFIENQKRYQYILAEDSGTVTDDIKESWGNATKALLAYKYQLKDSQTKDTKPATDDTQKEMERELERVTKILHALKEAKQQEIDEENEKYEEEKALLEKYHKDTEALTIAHNKKLAEINQKYADEEKQKLQEQRQIQYDAAVLAADEEYYQKKRDIVLANEKNINEQLTQLDLAQFEVNKQLLKQQLDSELITNKEYQTQLTQIEYEEAERRKQIAEEEAEKKKQIQEAYRNSLNSIMTSISSVLGSTADMLGDDTEEYKNIKAAEAIISTLAAAVAAFAGITKDTGGWGLAAAIAQAAAVVATGMATVKRIYAVDTSGNKNSTATTSSTAVSSLTTSYNNTRLMDGGGGVYDLSQLMNLQRSTKVYVTTHDIQEGLDKVNVTTRRNTF